MIHAYIGLLRADGTEPDKASGYRRVMAEAEEGTTLGTLLETQQIVFPDATAPGYGMICAAALYDREDAGEAPLCLWKFPEAVDVHQGVVPVIHKGKLWRGVETRATITVTPGIRSAAGGLQK